MGNWQMKGYNTSNGYMGYVEGKYILFASEQEYFEFMEDWEGGRNMSKVYFVYCKSKIQKIADSICR